MATKARSFHPASGHTALASTIFWAKSRGLIGQRIVRDLMAPLPRLARMADAGGTPLAIDESALYTATDARERELELGKIQNLRIAARAIDGMVLEPGQVFSFWRALGRPLRAKGYVTGRELRQGCMVPTIAGGICQLTNALSRVAHRAGLEIVERHKHSAAVDGLVIDEITDATVFWNYKDLRFRADRRTRIAAYLTDASLIVRLDALS
jgi:vancomycin resistance protein YoaR